MRSPAGYLSEGWAMKFIKPLLFDKQIDLLRSRGMRIARVYCLDGVVLGSFMHQLTYLRNLPFIIAASGTAGLFLPCRYPRSPMSFPKCSIPKRAMRAEEKITNISH